MNEQKHITKSDSGLLSFLTWFQSIEDRLVLVCLPVVIFSLVLWAIASAFPIIGTIVNLVISISLLLVTCVMLVRLVEIAWRWVITIIESNAVEEMYMLGVIGIAVIIIVAVICLLDMITHAGTSPGSRVALFVGLLFLLPLQYRAIIHRHLVTLKSQEEE